MEIDISHISSSFIEMISLDHEIPVEFDRFDQDLDLSLNNIVEYEQNPLDVYHIAVNVTALNIKSHFGDEFTTIAPVEGNML